MIIIGDVHGRTFWKKAVEGRESEQIVFLGDYTDYYYGEFDEITGNLITSDSTLNNFKDIIDFKKSHKENVILLLGNHDCTYMYPSSQICNCRTDTKHFDEISDLFQSNKELFQICYETFLDGKHCVFSHAGIHKKWVRKYFNDEFNEDDLCEMLNSLYHCDDSMFIRSLGDISSFRGGLTSYGSIVWADMREWFQDDSSYDFTQIFGHTQLRKTGSVAEIKDKYYCMDSRCAFILDENGKIKQIEQI